MVFDREHRFALRILANGHAAHFERAQVHVNSSGMVDRFNHGVDGSVGSLIVRDDTAVGVRELDSDARRLIVKSGDAQ